MIFGTNPTVIGVSLGDQHIRFKQLYMILPICVSQRNPEEINITLPHGSVMI